MITVLARIVRSKSDQENSEWHFKVNKEQSDRKQRIILALVINKMMEQVWNNKVYMFGNKIALR